METLRLCLRHLFSLTTATVLRRILAIIQLFPVFVPFFESILSLYFRFCDLSPCTVDLDAETSLHFWVPNHRRFDRPNLVIIHGYGANAKWQFMYQVGSLARSFNLYVPDLLFFGKSHSRRTERSDIFQAKCVRDGLKELGVERCSVFGISYGGFVGYRMAHIYAEMVEKVVIVSSGIGCTEDQRGEQLRKIGRKAADVLLPDKPEDLRLLMDLSIHRYKPFKWVPDIFLHEFIHIMCRTHRKEKEELLEYLMAKGAEVELSILTQETLLIWGDKDNVFPLPLAHQLLRHLGPKASLEIIQDTGHAANIDSPYSLNKLIQAFVLDSPKTS